MNASTSLAAQSVTKAQEIAFNPKFQRARTSATTEPDLGMRQVAGAQRAERVSDQAAYLSGPGATAHG